MLIRSQRGQAYFLREVGEFLMAKHGGVTDELVNDIWLRCVKRLTVMPHVLSRVEHFESKGIQELSLSK